MSDRTTPTWRRNADLAARAAAHAALGEPARLALVEELALSDRSPAELVHRLGIPSNLLSHHLDVLQRAGLVTRTSSAGDRRRKYVQLVRAPRSPASAHVRPRDALFVCTHNAARSQLAAAMWTARTGRRASSAGTRPAPAVHRAAVDAAERAGLSLEGATPRRLERVPSGMQVITVCDLVHEELDLGESWWHWSIPDPVPRRTAAAFDAVVAELDRRIATVMTNHTDQGGRA